MAIKSKYRIKNARGTYDIMHFETSADQVVTSDQKQFVSNTEKSNWNGKETTTGAQQKADNALSQAKSYTDTSISNKADKNHNHDTVYLKKYVGNIGDGSNTTITVNHNLNTEDITITVRDASTKEIVYVDAQIIDVNSIKLLFYSAPTSSQYKIVITG